MKKICFLLPLFLITVTLNASHILGGEITWRAAAPGKFIFQMKIYRDCNGVSAPFSVTLNSNSPDSLITCYQVQSIDLTPTGPGCPTCSNPSGTLNAVEEHVYESDTILLMDSVPASGWYFSYSDCCRNGNNSNLSPGDGWFYFRAVMYPFSGDSLPNDNSPVFAYQPTVALCNGVPVSYSHFATDQDLDSISYSWAPCQSNGGGSSQGINYQYNSGYSFQSPFPGISQSPLNIPAQLNVNSGIINFTSFTSGVFTIVVKVTSWKCGEKTAEVFREVEQRLVSNCIVGTNPITRNLNPLISIVQTGDTVSIHSDTLFAGESCMYEISVMDTQVDSAGNLQNITLDTKSLHYGTNYTDSLNGCLIPPCATLQLASPQTDSLQILNYLNFATACSHAGFNNECLQHQRNYIFSFRALDDFCPVNGIAFENFTVTVRGPVISQNGVNLQAYPAGSNYQWYLNGTPLNGATDSIYSPLISGTYSLIITDTSGCQLISNTLYVGFVGEAEIKSSGLQNVYVDESGKLHLMLDCPVNTQVLLNLLTADGRFIFSRSIQSTLAREHIVLDVSHLSAGIYLVQSLFAGQSLTSKIVIR